SIARVRWRRYPAAAGLPGRTRLEHPGPGPARRAERVGAGWRCRARCRSSLPGSIRRHKSVRTTGEWKAGGAWGSLAWLYVRPRVGRLVQNISTARRFYTPVTLWDHRQAARYSRATTITTN